MILPVRNPEPPWDTEAAPQRYRISWAAAGRNGNTVATGSIIVKVVRPLYTDYVVNKRKRTVRMNIRAQAMHRADGYLKKTYPVYAQGTARTLQIVPIGDKEE